MDGEGKKVGRGRGRGRGRGGRGRARGRGRGKAPSTRGRSKKMVIESDEEEQIETSEIVDNQVDISDEGDDNNDDDNMVIDEGEKPEDKVEDKPEERAEKVEFNIDDDISQLVPPTFSTVSKGPPQPMLELSWDQKYISCGDKLPSPNVHMCIGCKRPIRAYGRLISCKHVFCYSCATKQGDNCSCCSERVHRVEKVRLGLVHMCLQGGKPYGYDGCRRTYLSQRDLQAHVNHRHKPRNSGGNDHSSLNSPGTNSGSHGPSSYDHGGSSSNSSHYNRQNIPVHYNSSSRSNLIAVPVHQAQQSNSQAMNRPQNPGDQSQAQPPGSRYERKPPFSRNQSWGSYNNRQF